MSPLARALRTFAAAAVGVLVPVVAAFQAGDYKTGGTVLTLGLATAALAAVLSAAGAAAGLVADSPIGKALATFLQFVVAGLGTVVFNTFADVVAFPRLALPIVVAALAAAAQTFFQNLAEDRSPA